MLFLLIFLGFNAMMLFWMLSYISDVGGRLNGMTGSEEVGTAAGGALVSGIILVVWVCGAVITGLLALLTRAR